jgi:hypothetical protein
LKRLLKYSATLFVLLLLAYTQVFAHIHREDFSASTHSVKSHHLRAPVAQSGEIGGDYFEEDNKRNLLKTFSGDNSGSDLFYAHVTAEYFFQRLEISSSFGARSSRFSICRASLFRVLRL